LLAQRINPFDINPQREKKDEQDFCFPYDQRENKIKQKLRKECNSREIQVENVQQE
jgi:hypothetical protein